MRPNPERRAMLIVVTIALIGLTASAAEKLDQRLYLSKKAYVIAVDDLGDDKPIATCFAAHLSDHTPMVSVAKDEAEIVLRVSGHVPSASSRYMLGAMGGSPSGHLFAELPDGHKLWDDGAKVRRGNVGTQVLTKGKGEVGSIECGIADELLDTLREAMRKARGK